MSRVLFVCLGNICRSPAAEGIFSKMVRDANLQEKITVDSAGTGGWHVGEPPDGRMISHALQRGYDLSNLKARQFAKEDFHRFDYILTMDDSNFENVLRLAPTQEHHRQVQKMVRFCRIHEIKEVPDPYYREADGFEHVLDILEDACSELLEKIKAELS